eukprot:m.805504 g.805504  ORF g.805504 m.805504 type:complete len:1461 (-) comp59290_c0_seq12:93-4475(-)
MELGINLESGLPTLIGFEGGVEVFDESAYIAVELAVDEQYLCIDIENFNLNSLVTAAVCPDGSSCLGPAIDTLTSISCQSAKFTLNSNPTLPHRFNPTMGPSPCGLIAPGIYASVINLDLFKAISIPYMCFAANGKGIEAAVVLDHIDLGVISLGRSSNPRCGANIPAPNNSYCTAAGASHDGPSFFLTLEEQQAAMMFQGQTSVLNFLDVDVCVYASPTEMYFDLLVDFGSEASLNATVRSAISTSPPSFLFEIGADINIQKLWDDVRDVVLDLFCSFFTFVHQAAAIAKQGIQDGIQALEKANQALENVKAQVSAQFQSLIDAVTRAQGKLSSLRGDCERFDHGCHWYSPWNCVAAGGCWVAYGIAEGVLEIAKGALEAVKAVPIGLLSAAQVVVTAAQGVLEGLQLALDAAMALVDEVEKLATGILCLFEIDQLGFFTTITKESAEVTFHLTGKIMQKDFVISFDAEIDYNNIVSMAATVLWSAIKSLIPGAGSSSSSARFHSLGRALQDAPPTPSLPKIILSSGDDVSTDATVNSHTISPPLFPNVPGAWDDVCQDIMNSVQNPIHGIITVNLAYLSATGSFVGSSSTSPVTLLSRLLQTCFAPYLSQMEAIRITKDFNTHISSLSDCSQGCKSSASFRSFIESVLDSTWSIILYAPQSHGNGSLFDLPTTSHTEDSAPVIYSLFLQMNNFSGSIPASFGSDRLASLNLEGNSLTTGVEHLAQAQSLTSVDLSGNLDLALAETSSFHCVTEVFANLSSVTRFDLRQTALVQPYQTNCSYYVPIFAERGLQLVMNVTNFTIFDVCGNCSSGQMLSECFAASCASQAAVNDLLSQLASNLTGAIQAACLYFAVSCPRFQPSELQLLRVEPVTSGTVLVVTFRILRPLDSRVALLFTSQKPQNGVLMAVPTCPRPGVIGRECNFHCTSGFSQASLEPMAFSDFTPSLNGSDIYVLPSSSQPTTSALVARTPQCLLPSNQAEDAYCFPACAANISAAVVACPVNLQLQDTVSLKQCELAIGLAVSACANKISTCSDAVYGNRRFLPRCALSFLPDLARLYCMTDEDSVIVDTPSTPCQRGEFLVSSKCEVCCLPADQPVCLPYTQCDLSTQFIEKEGTLTTDRVCRPRTLRCGLGYFISSNGTATSNAQCSPCSTCNGSQYIEQECNGITNIQCAACQATCKSNEFLFGTCTPSATRYPPFCMACDPSCSTCNGPYSSNCTSTTTISTHFTKPKPTTTASTSPTVTTTTTSTSTSTKTTSTSTTNSTTTTTTTTEKWISIATPASTLTTTSTTTKSTTAKPTTTSVLPSGWFLGHLGQSCDVVCAGKGPCHVHSLNSIRSALQLVTINHTLHEQLKCTQVSFSPAAHTPGVQDNVCLVGKGTESLSSCEAAFGGRRICCCSSYGCATQPPFMELEDHSNWHLFAQYRLLIAFIVAFAVLSVLAIYCRTRKRSAPRKVHEA